MNHLELTEKKLLPAPEEKDEKKRACGRRGGIRGWRRPQACGRGNP